jgi:TolB protein
VKAQLINDLTYSDWYALTNDEAKIAFYLTAVYSETGGTGALEIRVADRAGVELAAFRQTAKASEQRWLVHAAVDTLLKTHFGTTGFCTTQLLYVKEVQNVKEVYLAEFDGAEPSRVTVNGRLSTEPDWGPGNGTMIYTLYGSRSTWLMMMNRRTREQQAFSRTPGLNAGGAISPDGRQVAMILSKDGQVDLYVMEIASKKLKRLTNNASNEASPTWSPDGKQLCFVSDHASRQPTLYTISANGGTPKKLLKNPGEAVSPDWSPDGQKICFATRVGSNYHIGVWPGREGADFDLVTKVAGDWEGPSWAADSRHIVCSRNHSGSRVLVLVDSWYYKAQHLHNFTGDDTLPDYAEARR